MLTKATHPTPTPNHRHNQELNLASMAADAATQPPLTPQTLTALSSLTALTSLDLSRRALPAQSLHALLAHLERLEALSLHGAALKLEEVAGLEKAFPRVSILKRHLAGESAPDLAALVGSLSIS